MKTFKMAVGTKIFSGSIALICMGALIGGAGYLSLNRVTNSGDINQSSQEVRARLLEARIFEKDFLIKKDADSFGKLSHSLDELSSLTSGLQSRMGQNGTVGQITEAQRVYKQSMEEIRKLEEDDAKTMTELRKAGDEVAVLAEDDATNASETIKSEILKGNEKTLKEYSRNEIKDIVSVGHDMLKFYDEHGLSREAALDAIRNLHYAGSNYYFVVQQDLVLVAHGSNRALEGQDFGSIQDKKTGKYFMKEVVGDAVKNGESFTEYYWDKPGIKNEVFPKVTYAKYYKPWDLIVCSGVYVDDIENQVAKTGEIIEMGLSKLQQANDTKNLMLQARLNAIYYVAFGQYAEKVSDCLSRLKIFASTDALKKKADVYLESFNRRIANNAKRQKDMAQVEASAANTLHIADEIEKKSVSSFTDNASSGKQFIIGFILAGAIVGFIFATLLTRTVVRPIKRAILGIDEASEQVAGASGQVSGASRQLAEGASEQAASIEETSSSLEEMSSMTKQNSEHTNQANQLMAETSQVVSRANSAMTELTSSITEISRASEETFKIIKTIDEIAFQTNLLALNAAVEAARAGEAGAGFAVVADEVRNLAMRSADAARNTASLIESTVKKVKAGAQIVDKTSVEFTQVAESTHKMGELIGEIAAASNEQSQGIEQINRAVNEMDRVVQQNAANAEESASASEEMNAQAEQMKGFVGELKALVDGRTGTTATSRAALPPGRMQTGEPDVKALPPEGRKADPASKANGKDGTHPSQKELSPEQMIPFDDTDMSDF